MHCVVLVTFARERKEEKPLFKQTLKVTFRIITSLSCCVWPVNSYFYPDIISQFMRNRIPCQRDTGTRLATALRRRPFSACNKGNRRRLHAGKHLGYARRFKSTNQCNATKQTSLCGVGLWFWTANGRDTLIGGFESTNHNKSFGILSAKMLLKKCQSTYII